MCQGLYGHPAQYILGASGSIKSLGLLKMRAASTSNAPYLNCLCMHGYSVVTDKVQCQVGGTLSIYIYTLLRWGSGAKYMFPSHFVNCCRKWNFSRFLPWHNMAGPESDLSHILLSVLIWQPWLSSFMFDPTQPKHPTAAASLYAKVVYVLSARMFDCNISFWVHEAWQKSLGPFMHRVRRTTIESPQSAGGMTQTSVWETIVIIVGLLS
jgi:hypothetical protein